MHYLPVFAGIARCCARILWLAVLAPFALAQTIPVYNFSTLAGKATGTANDGDGNAAGFNSPVGITHDHSGNLYVADSGNWIVRRVTPTGRVTTLAGVAGEPGYSDGAAASARFGQLHGIAVDNVGNVYVAESEAIRKISSNGVVTTFAGKVNEPGADDGVGALARFNGLKHLACDGTNYLYVADANNRTIRRVALSDGAVTTIAGLAGDPGSTDGIGSAARFEEPWGVALDSSGNILVCDRASNTIRKILAASGVVTTLAGSPGFSGSVDGAGSDARLSTPQGIAVDADGAIYVVEPNRIRKITGAGVVTTFAGSARQGSVNGGLNEARFGAPAGITARSGELFVADAANNCIRKISGGVVSMLAGVAPGVEDGPGDQARFSYPSGMAQDNAGNIYVADRGNHTIRKISSSGLVTTLAGSAGISGFIDGQGTAARFQFPTGLAIDGQGNIFVADLGNSLIRKITPAGLVSRHSGLLFAFGARDGAIDQATFDAPWGIVADREANLYVTDVVKHTVRKISADGFVTTLAGVPGSAGHVDGTGPAARFNRPQGITVDSAGAVYVVDGGNSAIRKITPEGKVTTLAGGQIGSSDGTGPSAQFYAPEGISIDAEGNLFVAEFNGSRIRRVSPEGVVMTIAGLGRGVQEGYVAKFKHPTGVMIGRGGKLYVTDSVANTLRIGSPVVPALSWSPPVPIAGGTSLSGQQLAASANVPGAFTYSPDFGAILRAGQHTLTASFIPAGVTSYPPITAEVALIVERTPAVVSWAAPAPIAYGTPLSPSQLNATCNVPGTFSYAPGLGAILTPGVRLLSATFTPDDPVNYSTVTAEVSVVVTPGIPSITWGTPQAIVYGTSLSAAQLNATSSVPGSFTYTPAPGTVLHAGAGQILAVVFTPDDSVNHASVTRSVTLNVNKASLVVTADDKTKVVGDANPPATLSFHGFVSGDGPASLDVLPSVTFDAANDSPTGQYGIRPHGGSDNDYDFVLKNGTLTVTAQTKVPTIISSATAAFVVGSKGSFTVTADGTPSPKFAATDLPAWISLDSATGIMSGTPPNALGSPIRFSVTATNPVGSATQAFTLSIQKAKPIVSWPPLSSITYGVALTSQQLNATGSVPGTFAYSPSAGTILNAGSNQTLTATFTPNDTLSYEPVTSTNLITVAKAPLIVSATNKSKVEGEPVPVLTIDYSGFVSGQTAAMLDQVPSVSTTATESSRTGAYPIAITGGADENYDLILRNGTLTVAAFTSGPTFTVQPANQLARVGRTALFAAQASGTPTPSYQWQVSTNGGTIWSTIANGSHYAGVTTSNLMISGVTQAMEGYRYRALASNSVGSAESAVAVLAVQSAETVVGTYFGNLVGGRGMWALRVEANRNAVFIAFLAERKTAIVTTLKIAESGSFTAAGTSVSESMTGSWLVRAMSSDAEDRTTSRATAAFTISGTIIDGSVTGQISGLEESLTGSIDAVGGAAPSGYYSASAFAPTGSTHAIVAPSGRALIVASASGLVEAASGVIDSSGRVTMITLAGGQLAINLSSGSTMAAVLIPAGTTTPIRFGDASVQEPGPNPEPQPGNDGTSGSRLVALAARAAAGSGDRTLIVGFVVQGNKQVLVQGVGPGIANSVPTALTDPQLKLYRLSGGSWAQQAENNDWVNRAEILNVRSRLGATALSAGSKDAALLQSLDGGVYTAHVTSPGASGVALVEAYDADQGGSSRLVALSTRTVAGAGDDTLIAGLVLEGSGSKRVLIRGLGPTLASRDGVTGVLSDPQLKLYRMAGGTSTLVGENDNWGGAAEMKNVFATIGAGPLESDGSKDAAVLATLNPGVYTVHVSGAAGTTGVALVEIFDVP